MITSATIKINENIISMKFKLYLSVSITLLVSKSPIKDLLFALQEQTAGLIEMQTGKLIFPLNLI